MPLGEEHTDFHWRESLMLGLGDNICGSRRCFCDAWLSNGFACVDVYTAMMGGMDVYGAGWGVN